MTTYTYRFKPQFFNTLHHNGVARELHRSLDSLIKLRGGLGARDGLRLGSDISPGMAKGKFYTYRDGNVLTSEHKPEDSILTVMYDAKTMPGNIEIETNALTIEQVEEVLASYDYGKYHFIHLASYKNGKQNLLNLKVISTTNGECISNIARWGILHHPVGRHSHPGTFYPFAPNSQQDRLEDGFIRINVKVAPNDIRPHYLSIDNIEGIVKAPLW